MTNVFVCGDFNSPHQELNCAYDSENGEKLLNLIDNGHFKLLNNGHHTYQSFDGKSKNMLDLHFCDSTVFTNFRNFEVSEDLGSDHRTTITTFNLIKSKKFELKSETDFRRFRENVKKSYRSSNLWPAQYPGKDKLNEFSSNLVEIIHKLSEDSYVNKNKPPYSIETQKLIKLKRKKRRDLKGAFGDELRSLKTEINYLQKEIKRSIGQSEEQKRAKILERARDKGSKGFWRAIKELTNDHESKQKTGDYPDLTYKESKSVTGHEKSELFKQLLKDTMKDHTTVPTEIAEHCEKIEKETKAFLSTNVDTEELCIMITTKEFDEILRVSRKSCPGTDKISYKVLSELPRSIKALACLLISSSINNSYIPVNWKESQITMIPKQDKDRSKAENYRPISLTNCLAKVCETVVKNIVLEHCENLNIFGETQSAYRKHRCTTDNLIKLTQHVSEAFQRTEMVGLVCLDVEKAFDAVWRLGLIHKLNSFLSQRNVYVKINTTVSASFCPTAGVPLGSVIAPILFLIYVSRLPKMNAQISVR